ncbi:hypothetical protein ACRAWF_13080, partial [Streptomyces sp. L7]
RARSSPRRRQPGRSAPEPHHRPAHGPQGHHGRRRKHTRTVPGLGTYRITVLDDDNGVQVLAGLPMDDVQDMISGLVVVEAAVALTGLTVAGFLCAVVIRRQLRPPAGPPPPPSRSPRSPLRPRRGHRADLVPERDTDPGSEAGQVGAALNRMIDHVESSLAERQRSESRCAAARNACAASSPTPAMNSAPRWPPSRATPS